MGGDWMYDGTRRMYLAHRWCSVYPPRKLQSEIAPIQHMHEMGGVCSSRQMFVIRSRRIYNHSEEHTEAWECFVLDIQCILELKLLEMWSIRSQQSLYGMHPHSKNHNRPALPWDKSPFPSSLQDHQSDYHSHDLCNFHALPPHHLYIFLLFV